MSPRKQAECLCQRMQSYSSIFTMNGPDENDYLHGNRMIDVIGVTYSPYYLSERLPVVY
jgi:hypothetical protein